MWAAAGVMFRDPPCDTAAYADVDETSDGHVFFQWRANDGGTSFFLDAGSAFVIAKCTGNA
jgi:hypothetical protein